jgi:D-alanyl-D-alanine carboxypeptidase
VSRRARVGLILAVLAVLALGWTLRPSAITPPADPADPVTIRLLSTGRHSGLLLPCGDGRVVEYDYGEWDWYALGMDEWWRAPATVLWPNAGTLGRRYVRAGDLDPMGESYGSARLSSFTVERRRAAQLLARLDAEFAAGAPAYHSDLYDMDFVKTHERFHLFHDCHDEVADWLSELGCSVAWAPIRTRLVLAGLVPRAPASDIDRYVRAEMARRHVPGLALLVAKDHRILLSTNYGVADVETKAPVTDRTSFEIASMTKQFTDAAVLLLAQRGVISVEDRLSRYFPDLPPAWEPITIRQLMNHTSGLRDDWDEDDRYFSSKTSPEEFFEALKASPLEFAPGTAWGYGCGPFVLGLLIERVTGKPYARFMRESVFQPLELASTEVNDPVAIVPERASGYVFRDGVLRSGVRISAAAEARADVGIRTTTHDLALWDAALDDGKLLTQTGRELMFTPARLPGGEPTPCGLGWFNTPYRGHVEIAHGGGFRTGFSTVIARYPDDGLTVIVLTNLQTAHAYSIARGVASCYDRDYRPISSMEVRPDADPERTRVAGRILAALRDGRSTDELLPVASRLSPWSPAEIREELSKASPPTFVDRQDLGGRQVDVFGVSIASNGFYRTDGDKPRYWTFSFTSDGHVAYLELEE